MLCNIAGTCLPHNASTKQCAASNANVNNKKNISAVSKASVQGIVQALANPFRGRAHALRVGRDPHRDISNHCALSREGLSLEAWRQKNDHFSPALLG